MNYYQHHLGDYLRDTAHLSMLEDGAYRRLIDAYYIRERPLPGELREVYRLRPARVLPAYAGRVAARPLRAGTGTLPGRRGGQGRRSRECEGAPAPRP